MWPMWRMDECAASVTVVDALPVGGVLLFVHPRYEHCAVVPRRVIAEVLLDLRAARGGGGESSHGTARAEGEITHSLAV